MEYVQDTNLYGSFEEIVKLDGSEYLIGYDAFEPDIIAVVFVREEETYLYCKPNTDELARIKAIVSERHDWPDAEVGHAGWVTDTGNGFTNAAGRYL